MDIFKNLTENLPFIIGAIALVAVQYFLRKRRGPEANQQEMVQNILAEVKLDLRMAEAFSTQWKAGRLMTTSWQLYKDKMDFLPQAVQDSLNKAFALAEDYNQQMAAAKKFKSNSYMSGIDMGKLKPLLAAGQDGLEQWLLLKVGSRNPPVKSPGVLDDLIGRH